MSPKALKALVATLREQGVSQYKLVKQGELQVVEIKLFPQPRAPAAPAPEAPKQRPTEALRAEREVPEPLRKVISPDAFAAAVARANALQGGD